MMSLKHILSGMNKPVASMEADEPELKDDAVEVEETTEAEETETEGEEAGEGEEADEEETADEVEVPAEEVAEDVEASDDTAEGELEADDTTEVVEETDESEVGTDEVEPEDADGTIPVYESIPSDPESAEIIEMNSSMEAYEESLDDSDELEYRIEKMNELHDKTNESIDAGGLNKDGCAILKIALHLVTDKATTEVITPSVESFGGTYQRRASTEASAKGIAELIKSAAKSAYKFLMDLFKRSKDALQGVFSARKDIENKINRIVKKADGFKGKVNKLKLSSSEAAALAVDGKVAGGTELMNQYIAFVNEAKGYVTDSAPFDFAKKVGAIKVNTASDAEFHKSYEEAVKLLATFPVNSSISESVGNEYKEQVEAGLTVTKSKPLFENTHYVAAKLTDPSKGSKSAGMQFIRPKKEEMKDGAEIDGIPADVVSKFSTVSVSIFAIMDVAETNAKKTDAAIKEIGAVLKSLEQAAAKSEGLSKDAQTELKELTAAIRKVLISVTVQYVSTSRMVVNVTNKLLSVANKSLAGKAEEKADTGNALPKPKSGESNVVPA